MFPPPQLFLRVLTSSCRGHLLEFLKELLGNSALAYMAPGTGRGDLA